MITVTEAQQQLVRATAGRRKVEQVELNTALGRVCAQDVASAIDVPPADNSAMDGFAVNSHNLTEEPVTLPVSQRVPAGAAPHPLKDGTAARIFTGGVMPAGADAVVIQENCDYEPDGTSVTICKRVAAGDNVRPQGQDIRSGATVVTCGKRLSAIDLGLIASVGVERVSAYSPLRVAIFSTGDELVEPGKALQPGQIYNSNRTSLMALCRDRGYRVVDCGIVADTLQATCDALAQAAAEADVIVSSGGVSVGEEDHVKPAVEALGSLDLWKVQMKPGKPVAFGKVGDTPFLGLPGNPVSSFVVFQLLAVPLLATLQGEAWNPPTSYRVIAAFDKPAVSREEYIRVRIIPSKDGAPRVDRFANLSSGVLSSLSWADGLVRQTIGTAIVQNQEVEFIPLQDGHL